MNGLNDTVEIAVDLAVARQPKTVDATVLRRAMMFGQRQKSWLKFQGKPFDAVEGELRTAWLRREGIAWNWVRAAVRAGYEPESLEN